jgi:uncharacterized protein (TIGR00266 family)
MEIDIQYRPSYSLAILKLASGEQIQAESGAMVSMSPAIEMQTQAKGGMLAGLKRATLGGESFFLNTFTAKEAGAEITLAPSLPGDVANLPLAGQTLYIQSGSYMASATGIQIDSKWGGAKTFFSGEGLFMLKATGTGDLLLSSYGAIHTKDLAPGERYVMDTGHMVAFTDGMQYEVRRVGGWKQTIFSGEGLVVDLTGPGRIYIQTRSPGGLVAWLIPQLPKQQS